MRPARFQPRWRALMLFGLFLAGCTTPSRSVSEIDPPTAMIVTDAKRSESIRQTSFSEAPVESNPPPADGPGESATALPAPTPLAAPTPDAALFAGAAELSVDDLIERVLARNPSVAEMIAAWKAAAARYPQVISLDDPLLQGGVTPSIFGGEHLHGGWQATLSQKYPWPGKLRLRGENVLAQARAAANDVDDIRLQLIENARLAFFNFYLVDRSLEVNQEGLRLMTDFKKNAEDRYASGLKKATRQDIDQADVEIGRLQERDLLLKRARQVAIARINTLMHLLPDNPLPPAPAGLAVRDGLPDLKTLYTAAWNQRPDLRALANRIQAEEAALALAYKEYYPDFDLIGTYNTLWQPALQQPLVGVRMNVPVRLARRRGAVWEARAKIAERQAELARQIDQVDFEVQEAYARVIESEKTARLYDETILKAARLNVKDAQSSYISGLIPFVSLIRAERDYVDLFDRYYQAVANYHSQVATLERVVGTRLATLRGEAGQPDSLPGAPFLPGVGPCCRPEERNGGDPRLIPVPPSH